MTFLPFENITYKTKLGEGEILKRLHDLTVPTEKLRFELAGLNASKPYSGEINREQFNIKRMIKYVNSWLPMIYGTIKYDAEWTIINVKMRMRTGVTVFSFIWIALMGVVSYLALTAGPFYQFYVDFKYPFSVYLERLFHWIPVGAIMLMYIGTMSAFKYESRKSMKDLQKIFEAQIIK